MSNKDQSNCRKCKLGACPRHITTFKTVEIIEVVTYYERNKEPRVVRVNGMPIEEYEANEKKPTKSYQENAI